VKLFFPLQNQYVHAISNGAGVAASRNDKDLVSTLYVEAAFQNDDSCALCLTGSTGFDAASVAASRGYYPVI
jgi:hypothetical protein